MGSICKSNGDLEFYLKGSDIENLNNDLLITGYSKDEMEKETEIFYVIKLEKNLKTEPKDFNFIRDQKAVISINKDILEKIVKNRKFQFSFGDKKITFFYSKPNENKYY
jgi:hypothetical protein